MNRTDINLAIADWLLEVGQFFNLKDLSNYERPVDTGAEMVYTFNLKAKSNQGRCDVSRAFCARNGHPFS